MKADLLTHKEERRLEVQAYLDAMKSKAERNRMGQFATPFPLAMDILSYAKKLLPPGQKIRFLDPGFGTGAFYSALLQTFPAAKIAAATGYEIDLHYGRPALQLWSGTGVDLHLSDFTKATPPEEAFNLVICNPPYVRHHHIPNGEKVRLQAASHNSCGVQYGGLAGLYCYFFGTLARLDDGGRGCRMVDSQ